MQIVVVATSDLYCICRTFVPEYTAFTTTVTVYARMILTIFTVLRRQTLKNMLHFRDRNEGLKGLLKLLMLLRFS